MDVWTHYELQVAAPHYRAHVGHETWMMGRRRVQLCTFFCKPKLLGKSKIHLENTPAPDILTSYQGCDGASRFGGLSSHLHMQRGLVPTI